jgi:hypothetical protein
MLWGIQNQLRFFISSDLGQQVTQHDVAAHITQLKDFVQDSFKFG